MKQHLRAARAFATLMDNQFSLFGIRFGIDAIIGLIPGGGDFVSFLLSGYLIWIGYQLGLPPAKIGQMMINIVVDFLIGIFPFLGDIGDFLFKANLKNLQILEDFANHVVDAEIIE